ncbi:DUF788-domain-containing protein [Artomyces pyxidatus]|uniref:DUF788-domain-containing protein n=1 Tax=Artomyces pyxidatus TaxID=48021 RepID=A0ACB8TKQ7_9AGAM|nr:DUF788-domain-containing protein [Artomyces pyxidatus]
MANASAKRIASQNEAALKNLFYGQTISNVLPILLRILFRLWGNGASKTAVVFYTFSLALSQLLYRQLVKMGTPKRDATGSLAYAGDDLNQPGMTEWFFDILYISWIAQVGTSIVGEWFWWIYAVIPIFLVYKLWGSFISPMLLGRSSSAAGADDAAPEETLSKRQEKLKKRSERGDARVKTQTRR